MSSTIKNPTADSIEERTVGKTTQTPSPAKDKAAKRARRLETMPSAYRKQFERSYDGKASPRTAIRCQCLECIGFERAAITECASYLCPLYPLRPYQKKT
jgi:hypothetical protein